MKFTITKTSTPKDIQTRFGLKKKTGVLVAEFPDIWHDVWADGLKVGQVIEGERTSRDWEGKTYWSIQLPKKGEQAVQAVKSVEEKVEQLLTKVGKLEFYFKAWYDLHAKELPKKSEEIEYPDEINPEDIPFLLTKEKI